MAEKTLRENFFESLQKGAKWDVGVSINRTNPLPLDQYSVFKSESDLDTYIKGAFAYPGQVVAVVGEDETAIYYLTQNKIEVKDEAGEVTETKYELIKEEVGSMPAVDNKSIKIKIDETTGEEILTLVGLDSAVTGASLIKLADGSIGWSTTTQEGLTADLTEIKSDIAKLETTTYGGIDGIVTENGLTSKVAALETKFNEMGGVFNFVGSFTSAEFANEKAENYDIGDVVLVDGKDEYLCVEHTYDKYILSEDVEAIAGKQYYTVDENGKYWSVGEVITESPAASGYYEIEKVTEKYWEQFGDPDGIEILKGTVEGHTTQITGLSTKVSGLETAVGAKAKPESTEGAGDAKPATGLYAYADEVATNKANAAKTAAEATAAAALKVVSDKVDKNTGDITTLNTNVALKADQAQMELELAKKVDATTYTPKIQEIEQNLALKANNAEIQDSLELKADKSTVNTALGTINSTLGEHDSKISNLEGVVGKVSSTPNTNSTGLIGRIEVLEATDTTHGQAITKLNQELGTKDDSATAVTAFGKAAEARALAVEADSKAQTAQQHSELVLGKETDEASANTVHGVKKAAATAQAKADEVYGLVTGDNAKVNQSEYNEKIADIEESITNNKTAVDTVIGTLPENTNVVGYINDKIGAIPADKNVKTYVDAEVGKKVNTSDYEAKVTELTSGINSKVDTTTYNTAINGINEKIGTLGNVMNFVGELEEITEGENKVLVIKELDAEGKRKTPENGDVGYFGDFEYVYLNGKWEKFGDTSAESGRISALETAVGDAKGPGLVKDVADLKAADVTINGLITNLDTKIGTETSARENAISAEQAARSEAIAAEQKARSEAIAAEAKAREDADKVEKAARESAITELKTYIDGLLEWGTF